MKPDFTIVSCPCCNDNITAMTNISKPDMGFMVQVGVGFQHEVCPTCGYSLGGFRFHTVRFKVQPQVQQKGGLFRG